MKLKVNIYYVLLGLVIIVSLMYFNTRIKEGFYQSEGNIPTLCPRGYTGPNCSIETGMDPRAGEGRVVGNTEGNMGGVVTTVGAGTTLAGAGTTLAGAETTLAGAETTEPHITDLATAGVPFTTVASVVPTVTLVGGNNTITTALAGPPTNDNSVPTYLQSSVSASSNGPEYSNIQDNESDPMLNAISCLSYEEQLNILKNKYHDVQKRILKEAHPQEFNKINSALSYAVNEVPQKMFIEYRNLLKNYKEALLNCPTGKCGPIYVNNIRDIKRRLSESKMKILRNSSKLTQNLVKKYVNDIVENGDRAMVEELQKIEIQYRNIKSKCVT